MSVSKKERAPRKTRAQRKSRTKKEKATVPLRPASCFEAAFCKRIGLSPAAYIAGKLGNSKLDDICYLFEIIAAEIVKENRCVFLGFDFYHDLALREKTMGHKRATVYNKLVRDKIPEIIQSSGKVCVTETLSEEAYIHALDAKLSEELREYQNSKSLEELADLLEVMGAVVKARGWSWEELTAVRKAKRAERGGFEQRILLKEVED